MGDITVTFELENTGLVAADEVSQLYIQWTSSNSPATPLRPELKNFARRHLEPGEKAKIQLVLSPASLATLRGSDLALVLAAGQGRIFLGGGQPTQPKKFQTSNTVSVDFSLAGATTELSSCS